MIPAAARSGPLLPCLLLLLAIGLLGANCNPPPALLIDSPASGVFTTAGSILIEGRVTRIDASIADVRVNGTPVVVQPDLSWSHTVVLDPVAIVNPVIVEFRRPKTPMIRKRITVMAGPSVLDGDFSLQSIAMRLNDPGIDQIEPAITGLVSLDLATLLPPGTVVINNFCYLDLFGLCIASTDAVVNPTGGSAKPPPNISSFSINVDSQTGSAHGDVLLNGLFVSIRATGVNCDIDINASSANIAADYGLTGAPDGSIDVVQLTSPAVSFAGFSDSTDCSGLLGGLVGFFVNLLIGDVQTLVGNAFVGFLSTVDVNGNTPIAAAIETALANVEIAGPIGTAIGVSLEAPIFDVFEDPAGLTLDSDARITASAPLASAPDLLASYHVAEPFPAFGPTTPTSGLPYHLGLCISTSAFNQLLKAEIESGLLAATIDTLNLGPGGSPVVISGGLLTVLVPEFSIFDPATLFEIEIAPTMAPILTDNPGPGGETAELMIPHLEVIVRPIGGVAAPLRVVVDATVGLDVGLNAGQLAFTIASLQPQDLRIDIVQNPLLANEPQLTALLQSIVPVLFPSIASSLGSFPLPQFLGLQPTFVEADRAGQFVSVFLDLQTVP